MLLWLDGGAEVVASVCAHPERIAALSNILESARRGENALYGERNLLNGLCESGLFSSGDSAYLRLAAQELTQVGAMLSDLTKIRLSTTGGPIEASGRDWVVPIERFVESGFLSRPLLIGESIRDARFLLIASAAALNSRAPAFRCSFLPSNGGGDVTAEVLQEYLRLGGPPFFCVVDSDKSCAADKFGQTSSRCLSIMRNVADGWCFRVSVLEARELENLLPVGLRSSLLQGMSDAHRLAHDRLCALPKEVSLFVCLKNGEYLCRFHKSGGLPRGEPPSEGFYCVECHTSGRCESMPGFGRLLVRALDYLTVENGEMPPFDTWPDGLKNVATELSHFGLAKFPMRA